MSRTSRPIRRRRWRAIAVVLGAGVGALAACAPITTQDPYSASDGVRATVGDEVQATNLLVVTSEQGAQGVLVGALTNLTDTDTSVTVAVGGETVTLAIDAGQTVLLDGSSEPQPPSSPGLRVEDVAVRAVPAAPGEVTDLTLSTPGAGEVTGAVPALDGTLAPHDRLVP